MSEVPQEVVREYLRAWENADVSAMERLVAPSFEHVVNGRHEDRLGLLTAMIDAAGVLESL